MRSFTLVCSCLLIAISTGMMQEEVCYDSSECQCMEGGLVPDNSRDWEWAMEQCEDLGGDLAYLQSPEDMKAADHILKKLNIKNGDLVLVHMDGDADRWDSPRGRPSRKPHRGHGPGDDRRRRGSKGYGGGHKDHNKDYPLSGQLYTPMGWKAASSQDIDSVRAYLCNTDNCGSSSSAATIALAVGLSVGAALIITVLAIIFWCCCRKRGNSSGDRVEYVDPTRSAHTPTGIQNNPTYIQHPPPGVTMDSKPKQAIPNHPPAKRLYPHLSNGSNKRPENLYTEQPGGPPVPLQPPPYTALHPSAPTHDTYDANNVYQEINNSDVPTVLDISNDNKT